MTTTTPANKRTRKPKGKPGDPLVRVATRGYYRDPATGQRLKSVTTILTQGVPKEALIRWSANYTAETALANLPRLVRASRGTDAEFTATYDWLRGAPDRKKNDRGELGKAIHKLIEAKILGEPIPQALLDNPEFAPYMAVFLEFVEDFRVEFEASEMVVANYEREYGGTLDYMLRSPFIRRGRLQMGDTKSGGELDKKGVYAEAGLQMAAYRHAQYGWLRDGSRIEMPRTYGGVVLHLRPEGCRVIPVECGERMFGRFLHAIEVARFTSVDAKHVLGAPLHPGDGHVLRADGTCRYCGDPAKPVAPTAESDQSPVEKAA